LGNLEHAQQEVTNSRLRRSLENAMRGAQRAARLTGRLLAFARRKPLEPRIVQLNVLVGSLSDLLTRTLGENIAIRTVLSDQALTVEVDPAELEGAILNLAVNARDAMPAGGELILETCSVALDSAYAAANQTEPGRYACIAISDTGCGIPADVLTNVFEPFFTTKPDGQGTGLGLSQVYGFARQSGGHVKIYSEPGIGTTVRIYLPSRDEAASFAERSPAAPQTENLPLARGDETILVVEDDEDVRNYSTGSLRRLGYRVHEAGDSASALEILKQDHAIDLLFTDLGLPGQTNGRQLAESAREIRPTLKVLITTAYAGGALMHDGRVDAGIELLNKPFSFAELARRVREVLDRERPQPQTTPRIMVVEDEVLLRMFVSDVLTEALCQVEEAGSFAEALAIVERASTQMDAAIVDIGLPDRPGDELAREIRRTAPRLPIILATGFTDGKARDPILQEPGVALLAKPFT